MMDEEIALLAVLVVAVCVLSCSQPSTVASSMAYTTTTLPGGYVGVANVAVGPSITLDSLFDGFPQTTLPESQCVIANCPFNNEDFDVPRGAWALAETYYPTTLEEAFWYTRGIDKEFKLSCGKSSLIMLDLMEQVPCDYRVYHLVNILDPTVGHSFLGIERDSKFLILDPLNCGGNNMLACINASTTDFYMNQGITRKDLIIGYQIIPYTCKFDLN